MGITKNKSIALSIIIPVFNGEKYLEECLSSIYSNSKDADFVFETIIVDDGSTDGSHLIYEKYKAECRNITCIKTDNYGVSHARNLGIANAAGKFIMFVDGDDLLDYDWAKVLSTQLTLDYDLIFMSKYFKKEEDCDISKDKLASYVTTYNDDGIMISGPYSKLFKRLFIEKNNLRFHEDIINGEDLLFSLEAVCLSDTRYLKKSSFYKVRHNSGSSTGKMSDKIIESEIKFNEEMKRIAHVYNLSSIKEENSFLTSIRTLVLRSGRTSYKEAKKFYEKILSNHYYRDGLSKYHYDGDNKSAIFCKLLSGKHYRLIYYLAKIKNKSNNTDILEEL